MNKITFSHGIRLGGPLLVFSLLFGYFGFGTAALQGLVLIHFRLEFANFFF